MTRKEMIKLVENVQKIDSYYSIMKNSNDVTIETWKKGNKIYVKNDHIEEFQNIENFKVFKVNNANKEIKLNNSLSYDPITDLKTRLKMDLCEYKYINKDIIDERDVYKFKLIERSPDKKDFIEFIEKLNNLKDRASRLNRYVGLNITDRTNLIDSINRDIANLNSKPSKSYEEQLEDTILIVKPLFTNYENNYGGQDVTVKEYGGESMFKYIMKSTDTYAKLGSKVDKLEQSLNAVNSNRASKNKGIYDTHQHSKLLIRTPNQVLPYRLREMRQKQISVQNEQKIPVGKRAHVVIE